MIILDTCALIFDALSPEKLTIKAKKIINYSSKQAQLFCCDISLWEIVMLIEKKRIDPGIETESFLQLILDARDIQVLPITIEIAAASSHYTNHFDPADRIIAATTFYHKASLITSDKKLSKLSSLNIIW